MPLPPTKYNLMLADPVARWMDQSGRKPNCTPEDILGVVVEYSQLVSWNFTCLAHLKEQNFYLSLNEVENPKNGMIVYIRSGRTLDTYIYRKGEWVAAGSLSDDLYKG